MVLYIILLCILACLVILAINKLYITVVAKRYYKSEDFGVTFDQICRYVNENEGGEGGNNISAAQEKEVIKLVLDYLEMCPPERVRDMLSDRRIAKIHDLDKVQNQ